MDTIYFVFQNSLLFTVPLVVVALGGMFSERSGIVNIALEGIMVIGAFFSIFFIKTFQGTIPPQLLFILAMFIAMFVGILFSLLHAYASINMKANQTISGTALNLFAPAFAVYTARMVQGVSQIDFKNNFRIPKVPLLGDIPVIGNLIFQNVYITTYIGIGILVVASIILYKTRFGLRLRACGGRVDLRRPHQHQLQRKRPGVWLPGVGGIDLRSMETFAHPLRRFLLRDDEDHRLDLDHHSVLGGSQPRPRHL